MVYFINRGGGMANEGPMSEENVREQIAGGQLGMNALIWAQGMPEWITVGAWMNQGAPQLPQTPSLSSQAQECRPVESGYGLPVPADKKGTACVTMAQWGNAGMVLFMVVFLCSLLLMIVMASSMQGLEAMMENPDTMPDEMMPVLLCYALSYVGMVFFSVIGAIGMLWTLVRVWRVLQMVKPDIGENLPTPGWAVGGLFIPFFNFYWMFVAYGSIPKFAGRLPGNPPVINPTTTLLMNVGLLSGCIIPPMAIVGVVCMFMFFSQVKKFLKWADQQ